MRPCLSARPSHDFTFVGLKGLIACARLPSCILQGAVPYMANLGRLKVAAASRYGSYTKVWEPVGIWTVGTSRRQAYFLARFVEPFGAAEQALHSFGSRTRVPEEPARHACCGGRSASRPIVSTWLSKVVLACWLVAPGLGQVGAGRRSWVSPATRHRRINISQHRSVIFGRNTTVFCNTSLAVFTVQSA